MSAIQLTLPDETIKRLASRAKKLNITIEQLLQPVVHQVAFEETPYIVESDWSKSLQALTERAKLREGRYPAGFQLDDSRESIYREREHAQL